MFAAIRPWLLSPLVALLVTAGLADAATAGWVTIRNDTRQVIVVQETVTQNGGTKRLKPVRLLPGESVRQYEPTAGVKTFEVYDGRTTTRVLFSGSVRVTTEDQLFSVGGDDRSVSIRPVPAK